jgi:hypothetical protein
MSPEIVTALIVLGGFCAYPFASNLHEHDRNDNDAP